MAFRIGMFSFPSGAVIKYGMEGGAEGIFDWGIKTFRWKKLAVKLLQMIKMGHEAICFNFLQIFQILLASFLLFF